MKHVLPIFLKPTGITPLLVEGYLEGEYVETALPNITWPNSYCFSFVLLTLKLCEKDKAGGSSKGYSFNLLDLL